MCPRSHGRGRQPPAAPEQGPPGRLEPEDGSVQGGTDTTSPRPCSPAWLSVSAQLANHRAGKEFHFLSSVRTLGAT